MMSVFVRLLDVVAGRTESQGIHGDILVNGRPPPDNFKFMTGYVIQVLVILCCGIAVNNVINNSR